MGQCAHVGTHASKVNGRGALREGEGKGGNVGPVGLSREIRRVSE